MESEKVKEIKKALEHCGEKVTCKGCPMYNNEPVIDWFECKKDLLQKTITLINELESENERLSNTKIGELIKENKELEKECVEWSELTLKKRRQTIELKDRIAELEKENKDYYDRLNNLQTYIDNHEEIWEGNTNNALKQFAEKVAKRLININGIKQILDETLKECLCDNHQ